MIRHCVLPSFAVGVLLFAACDRATEESSRATPSPGESASATATGLATTPAPSAVEPLRAIVETNRGTFTIDLYEAETPRTVASFTLLASQGFYDDQEFYGRSVVVRQLGRPVPEFSPGWTLPREFAPGKWFDRGGRVAATLVTNSDGSPAHGSGFFVTVKEQDRWNLVYPIFGDVVEGQSVVESLGDGDVVRRVTIEGDPAPLWAQFPEEVASWRASLSQLGPVPKPRRE